MACPVTFDEMELDAITPLTMRQPGTDVVRWLSVCRYEILEAGCDVSA